MTPAPKPSAKAPARYVNTLKNKRRIQASLLCFNRIMAAIEGFDSKTQQRALQAADLLVGATPRPQSQSIQ